MPPRGTHVYRNKRFLPCIAGAGVGRVGFVILGWVLMHVIVWYRSHGLVVTGVLGSCGG